jgi:cell division transport system ATP-binding protein
MTDSPMIEFDQVHKSYKGGQSALSGLSFEIGQGELVFVTGHSGAGKSTLFKLIAAMERPTSGTVRVSGQDVSRIKARAVPYLRRNLGLIFQDQKLLLDRSVLDNVLLPLYVTGHTASEAVRRARAALDKVGLLDREKANPLQLSGGDQQRLAIARAIVNRPAIVLADEPTANLDRESARLVVDVLVQFNQVGVTTLVSTHDESVFAGLTPRLLRLSRGRLAEDAA